MTVRLQLSTFISPQWLHNSSKTIQILRPWQSADRARTGINGKRQSKQLLKRKVFSQAIPTPPKVFLWDSNGFSSRNRMRIMRWWDTKRGL
jgi:hypothetical protein